MHEPGQSEALGQFGTGGLQTGTAQVVTRSGTWAGLQAWSTRRRTTTAWIGQVFVGQPESRQGLGPDGHKKNPEDLSIQKSPMRPVCASLLDGVGVSFIIYAHN